MNTLAKQHTQNDALANRSIFNDGLIPSMLGNRFGNLMKELTSPMPLGDFFTDAFNPQIDVYEKDNALHIDCELAGVNKDDVEVLAEEGAITIKGKKVFEHEEKQDNYYKMERSWGTFTRRIPLPQNCKIDEIQATNKNGVLHLVIPQDVSAVKKIEVHSADEVTDAKANVPVSVEAKKEDK